MIEETLRERPGGGAPGHLDTAVADVEFVEREPRDVYVVFRESLLGFRVQTGSSVQQVCRVFQHLHHGGVQGNLDHKKVLPPRTLQQAYA